MTKEQDLAMQRVRSALLMDNEIIEALNTSPRTVSLSGRTLTRRRKKICSRAEWMRCQFDPPDSRASVIDILSGKRKTR